MAGLARSVFLFVVSVHVHFVSRGITVHSITEAMIARVVRPRGLHLTVFWGDDCSSSVCFGPQII